MCQIVYAPYVVRVSSGSCAWTRKLDLFIKAPSQCRPRPETITFETQFFPEMKFEVPMLGGMHSKIFSSVVGGFEDLIRLS